MRLHHLEVTGFGPFAETVAVDFDRLSDAGLFLLSGPTGAGKTSVLDAVCFALYGDVPGDRSTAKRLRCDQAASGVAPRVVLEVTLAGRRFRLVRSPAWERPKKRGEGTTTQQASVVLAERIAGSWQTLSSRLDETGHLVTDLLGMNLTQFTQVAMLPQGRFQAFLRARADERQRLLQQLFRTGRFEAVERWLRDRRVVLRRSTDTAHHALATLASRVCEAAGGALPEGWDLHDLSLPAADGSLSAWVRGLAEDAVTRAHDAEAAARSAASQEEAARAAWESARAAAERRARLEAASVELDGLRAANAAHEADVERLEAARRAARVLPLHRLAREAEQAVGRAAAAVPAGAERKSLEERRQAATDAVARLRALEPRQSRLSHVIRELADVADRQARLEREVEHARTQAVKAVERLTGQLVEARGAHTVAKEAVLELRERALDVRQARLEGMAAEIAGGLAVGACCPVCGSADHPQKAAATPGAPDAAAEKAAQKAADDAALVEQLRFDEVRTLTAGLSLAEERAADPVDAALAGRLASTAAARDALLSEEAVLRAELAEQLDGKDLRAVLRTHQQDAETCTRALAALERLDRAREAVADSLRALDEAAADAGFSSPEDVLAAALDHRSCAALESRVAHHRERLAAVTEILAEAGDERPEVVAAEDVPALGAAHEAARRALGAATAARTDAVSRCARLTELGADLEAALAAWRPLREEHELVGGLAAFVEGKASDNQLQMRLSAYVLAYRLSQVVAAANERLARMSDQRYSLEHSGRRGAGDNRGGLGLLVRDDWSGECRDPATLSGGETFVVSLALALGLADVIAEEAGGAELDTLFVDEGFGSLDADTLDDVMDTLDSLRDGGRVVGVVSHVAEMRDRIPAQLVVTKSRRGSGVAVRGA